MKTRRVLVVLSRKSGAGADIKNIIAPLFNKYEVKSEFHYVDTPPQATKILSEKMFSYDAIAIYGGDGTVVAALKTLCVTTTPLIIVPGGTGNLIAKYLSLPSQPEKIIENYCKGNYTTHYFDIASTTQGLLALDIHAGWLAESTLTTPRSLKKRIGMMAYALNAVRKLPNLSREKYEFTLDDGRDENIYAYTSLFGNKAVQNFFGFKLFNKPERQATLELAFVTSLNPMRFWIWALGRLLTGRNIGGFLKTYYCYKVTIKQSPRNILFDDRDTTIKHPFTIAAGYNQTKVIKPLLKKRFNTLSKLDITIQRMWFNAFEQVRNTFAGAPLYRYSQVVPRLYVGGALRYKAIKEFRSWGVKAVVNMRTSTDPDFGEEIEILHLPTTDMHAPSIDSLQKGVDFIRKHVKAGDAVYVHCRHGRGRGPSMAAAYLIAEHGMTTKQAIDHLITVRPMTDILKNQKKRLKEFEKIINLS